MSGLGEWDDVDDEPAVVDLGDAAEADPQEASPGAGPPLYYSSLPEFVAEVIIPIFGRDVGEKGRADLRWSARWWESAEAIMRLEALWRSWEHLRLDPATGMSVWLRDHLDHHLMALMSPAGPFSASTDSARAGEVLPYEAPPAGLFVDSRP